MENQSNKVNKQIQSYCNKVQDIDFDVFDEAIKATAKRTGRINSQITIWCNKAGRNQIRKAMKKALLESIPKSKLKK